jgi:antitoxin (DNA-binding transcriptional repressor) of toxin-antitoxin stability system
MKHATIREIKHDTSRVLGMVETGQSVEIRRRTKAVAILSPVAQNKTPKLPDFAARLREIYGDTVLKSTHTDLINEARGER